MTDAAHGDKASAALVVGDSRPTLMVFIDASFVSENVLHPPFDKILTFIRQRRTISLYIR